MAGKYKITADIRISTTIEPDGYFDAYDALEFEDESSFYGEDVGANGHVTFMVEADSEDEATDKAREILDNISFHSNDIEWEIEDTTIEGIEEIVPPMDMERAKDIILAFIRDRRGEYSDDMLAALTFVVEQLLTP